METTDQKTILLVEDEAVIAMSQIQLLKKHGYDVIHILNGEKAIETVRQRTSNFDLILMDIDLGKGIDGTQAAREILKSYDIPVVFLSSHTEKEVVEKTEKITSYGYVIKNSGITILDASIKMAFKLFEAHKNINKQNMLIKAGNENLRVTIEKLENSNRDLIISEKESTRRTEEIKDKAFWLSESERVGRIGSYKLDINKGKWICSSVLDEIFGIDKYFVKNLESWDNLVHPEQLEEMLKYFTQSVVAEKQPFNKEYRIIRRNDGKERWVWGRGELISNTDGSPAIMIGVIQDITDQKIIEDALKKNTYILNKSQGIAHVGSWFLDLQINKLSWSDEEYRIFGIKNNGSELTYETFLNAVHPDDRKMVDQVYTTAILNNEPYEMILRIVWPDGTIRTVREKSNDVINESGKIIYSVGITQDITKQLHLESVIEKNESKSNTLIYELSERTKELQCMYNVSQLLKNVKKPLKEVFIDITKMVPSGWQSSNDIRCKVIFNNEEYITEQFKESQWKQFSNLHIDNQIYGQIEIYYIGQWDDMDSPFIEEEQNLLNLIANSLSETIDHRQNEEKIHNLLQEKELILKEVHHRIKNNMNTIMSLLSLQSADMESREAIEALEDARNRVQSMMVLYDKLYRGSDFQHLSIKDYLTTLTNEIVGNFDKLERIEVETNIEDFILNSKTVFCLGIIINELITNTMKYAFPNGEDGKIAVSAFIKDKRVTVIIQDNGIGIPESVNIETSEGFGIRLVSMLSEQLDAIVNIERGNGTKFIFKFDS